MQKEKLILEEMIPRCIHKKLDSRDDLNIPLKDCYTCNGFNIVCKHYLAILKNGEVKEYDKT